MSMTEARKRANEKWAKNNYEKIQFSAPKGYNEKIKAQADKKGLCKAGYLKALIDEDMKKGEQK